LAHRRITFARGTVGRFIKKHGIRMQYTQVPPFMICRKQTHPGEKFFLLTFQKPGGGYMKVPYSQGSGVKGYPEIEEVLGGMASENLIYNEYQTPEAFCQAFSVPDEDCEDQFKVLEGMAERTAEFLGAEAYTEMLEMAQEGGFELEGGTGWQRPLTCGL
jgi:hypothetical protein